MFNMFFFFSGMWINAFIERELKNKLKKALEFHEPKAGGKYFCEICGEKYVLDWEIVECKTYEGNMRSVCVEVYFS